MIFACGEGRQRRCARRLGGSLRGSERRGRIGSREDRRRSLSGWLSTSNRFTLQGMSMELTRICIMSWVWVSRSECEQFVQGCGVFKQVKKSKEILGQRTAALSEVAGGGGVVASKMVTVSC
jgi:hypothetical protein